MVSEAAGNALITRTHCFCLLSGSFCRGAYTVVERHRTDGSSRLVASSALDDFSRTSMVSATCRCETIETFLAKACLTRWSVTSFECDSTCSKGVPTHSSAIPPTMSDVAWHSTGRLGLIVELIDACTTNKKTWLRAVWSMRKGSWLEIYFRGCHLWETSVYCWSGETCFSRHQD